MPTPQGRGIWIPLGGLCFPPTSVGVLGQSRFLDRVLGLCWVSRQIQVSVLLVLLLHYSSQLVYTTTERFKCSEQLASQLTTEGDSYPLVQPLYYVIYTPTYVIYTHPYIIRMLCVCHVCQICTYIHSTYVVQTSRMLDIHSYIYILYLYVTYHVYLSSTNSICKYLPRIVPT